MAGFSIDDSGTAGEWKIRQGDGWPKDPLEFAIEEPVGTPVAGLFLSAKLTVRPSFEADTVLDELDSTVVGSPLSVLGDGSGVRIAAGALTTDDWPLTETVGVPAANLEPVRLDVEAIVTATGLPDTLTTIGVIVLPQVTR